jgi:EAL domain-containing protein (putative c-di-GMP-specific phosphodiesterase class I)
VLSGQASFDAALRAINGAEIYRFLVKPCPAAELEQVLREALTRRNSLRRFARWERDNAGDLALQTARFERVLEASWIAWQPIVDARDGRVYAHEALLRSDDAEHPTPERVLALAARAGRSIELGRRVRLHVADGLAREADANDVFVNVDPCDLADDTLVLGADELARHARRVVLEITERDTLAEVPDLDRRLASLRALGYRIAIDDLGGGYSGLTSLARVLPDIVKFDMELVRGIDGSPTRQRLLGPMVRMCRDMGIRTLAEGVETEGERTTVVALGCDLLQGFLLGRPERDARARQPGRDVVSAA